MSTVSIDSLANAIDSDFKRSLLNSIALFGKGIGRRVIRSAIDTMLPKAAIKHLYLNVRRENMRAVRCYQGLGFETIYEGEKITDSGGKIKYLRMKRTISA